MYIRANAYAKLKRRNIW